MDSQDAILADICSALVARGAWRDARFLWREWRDQVPVPFEMSVIGLKTPYSIALESTSASEACVEIHRRTGQGGERRYRTFEKETVKVGTNQATRYKATLDFAPIDEAVYICSPKTEAVPESSAAGLDLLVVSTGDEKTPEKPKDSTTQAPRPPKFYDAVSVCIRSFGLLRAKTMAGLFANFHLTRLTGMGVPLSFPENVYDFSRLFYHQWPRFNQPTQTWTFAIADQEREVKFDQWADADLPRLFNEKGKFLTPQEAVATPDDSEKELEFWILAPRFIGSEPYLWAVVLHHAIRMCNVELLGALLDSPGGRRLCMNQNGLQWLATNRQKLQDLEPALQALPILESYADPSGAFLRAREFARMQAKAEKEKLPKKAAKAKAKQEIVVTEKPKLPKAGAAASKKRQQEEEPKKAPPAKRKKI